MVGEVRLRELQRSPRLFCLARRFGFGISGRRGFTARGITRERKGGAQHHPQASGGSGIAAPAPGHGTTNSCLARTLPGDMSSSI